MPARTEVPVENVKVASPSQTSENDQLAKIEEICKTILQNDNTEPDLDESADHESGQEVDQISDEARFEQIKKMVERIRQMEKDMENK